jgi:hypothetical protein
MARKTTITTPPTPTRTPRKPANASQVVQDGNGRQKGTTGQGRPSSRKAKGTAEGKANPFDTIAKMAADGASTADLTDQLQQSLDQAKAKPVVTRRQAKPVGQDLATERQQAKRTGTATSQAKTADMKVKPPTAVVFKGRPTSNLETIAQRAKESGLRVRASIDVADIAQRLRATEAAVSEWLAARDGSKPTASTKATTAKAKSAPRAPAKPEAPPKPLSITLRHEWADREPDYLRGCTLVVNYRVDPDGTVWSTITAIEGPDGAQLPHRGMLLPVDFRPQREVHDNGRKVILKDRTIAGLTAWLQAEGLTEQQ